MRKFKKLIAIMLVAVLFAGTGIMDMGAKEVQAEETTIDAFDISVDASGVVEAGQDVVFNIHVSNTMRMSCTMNMFNHFYYENTEAEEIEFGKLVLLGEDGEDDVVLTDDNLSTVSFEALQTKEFTLSGTLPESWNDESDITLVLAADCTDEEYPDTTFWSQFTYTAASEGGEDEPLSAIDVSFYTYDEEFAPGETAQLYLDVVNNTEEETSYFAEFIYRDGEDSELANVDLYYNEELVSDFDDFSFYPGEPRSFYVEWEVPEYWVDGESQLEVTISNSEHETTAGYSVYYDEGSGEEDESYVPNEDEPPVSTYLYQLDSEEDIIAGETVELDFGIFNNTTEETTFTADFSYISGKTVTDTTVTPYLYDWDEEEKTAISSVDSVQIKPGDWQMFVVDWEVPEDWDDEECRLTVEVSDGTNYAYATWPDGYMSTYEDGDIKCIEIKMIHDSKDSVEFAEDENVKRIPIEITVDAKPGWELTELELDWMGLDTYSEISQDEFSVTKIEDGVYRTELEINKYIPQDKFLFENCDFTFEKQLSYDINGDSVIDEKDTEMMWFYYWSDYNYEDLNESGMVKKVAASNETPVYFDVYFQDGFNEDVFGETDRFEYKGQADFTVTKSLNDSSMPEVTDIELLTDINEINPTSEVSVKVDYKEYGSGIKDAMVNWYNREGEHIVSAEMYVDEMETVTGEGSFVLTTPESESDDEEEGAEQYWKNNDEYYIGEIALTDWAGNMTYYGSDNHANKQVLEGYELVWNEETQEYEMTQHEVSGVSFSRGNKHLYAPVASSSKYKADAAKKKNGKGTQYCLICGKKGSSSKTIYYPKTYKIGNVSYTGEAMYPGEITIKDSNGKPIHSCYYDVEYPENAVKVGTHKVKITFKENYKGTVTKSFMVLPSAVENLNAEVSGAYNSVKVSWDKSTGASGYYISYRKGSKWSTKSTSKTSYTVTGLSAESEYEFRVVPYYTKSGKKYYNDWEYEYTTCTTQKKLSAPSSVTAALKEVYNDVKLTWKAVTGADGYNVYYKGASDKSYTFLGGTTETYTYEADGLDDGVKYTFKVVPYYYDEDGNIIEGFLGKTTTVYIMKAPGTPKVTRYSSSKVKVAWTNISGETGYQISKSEDPNVDGTITTYKTTSGKSKTITAKKGVTYYYKVRAYKTVNGKPVYGPWTEVKEYTRTR